MKRTLLGISTIAALLCMAVGLVACAAIGSLPTEEQRQMYQTSDNYKDDTFINNTPVNMDMEIEGGTLGMIRRFFFDNSRIPKTALPMNRITAADFGKQPQALQVTWLGHSTTILDIDGIRVLIDPVFDNASPVPMTVKRFQAAPISRNDLPRLDAVVISHDHYDHLEMKTVKALIPDVPLFIVPLGVGARLQKWGCPQAKIVELDWWQGYWVKGVEIVATPSRHFSGRGINDRFKTLWASFVFKGPDHRAFYSGDGGYDTRFEAIGDAFGPFDLTMIEIGAWNTAWPDVHLFPQQSVQAHLKLGGKYMLPVHWAAYDLSFHQWDDPIKLARQHAEENGVTLLTPMMGEQCRPGVTQHARWWEKETVTAALP